MIDPKKIADEIEEIISPQDDGDTEVRIEAPVAEWREIIRALRVASTMDY